ncbi:hypothetical protein EW146_g4942 [Bondarzewia mesenterica]|uniref:Uncharacterized protein n=1 Tax=Bondarzewia mesenterica TaxID=1095465 RepID=A0A4S4LU02_9AGAM|nr:hypothetical protein EW146_g4942 [Bondarzewia mesenterica]
MKMRNPWDDVVLTDGTGYMVAEGNYKDYLQAAIESKDMNMNYSLSGALKSVGDLPQVLIMYDVMCQYGMHLLCHFADSPHLAMPSDLEIIKGIVLALCKKYIKAMDALQASQEGFQALDTSIDHWLVERWAGDAENAVSGWQDHLELLDIYDVQKERSWRAGSTGIHCMTFDWNQDTGGTLENQITTFQKEAKKYIGLAEPGAEWEDIPPDIITDSEVNEDEPIPEELVEEYADDIPDTVPTEKMAIALPSTLWIIKCRELGLEELANQELELQKGQANDALYHMWITIGHKSFLFHSSIRQANS